MQDHAQFYVTGGTIPPDSPSYVERAADKELLAALGRGELCYVLNARQMGKSSLSVRTRQALEAAGTRTAFLDLQKFGSSASAEQWYRALLERIGSDLKLRAPFLTYWKENSELPPLSRLFGALRDVALEQIDRNVVVFLDEIDVVRDLSFKTDEFFGAIRESHNARADDPALQRLTFCIIGTVAPTDLIRDVRLSPFNIGTRVRLADLTPKEAAPLAVPLPGGAKTLDRVLWWTSGHPYLTQRLCAELTNAGGTDVDAMVARLFFAKSDADVDENIKNVRNGLLRMGGEGTGFDRTDLLTRYGAIASGKRVPDDDTDGVCTALRLSGLVTSSEGTLRIRNRVYGRLFDAAWVRANLPDAEVRRQQAAVARARWQVATIALVIVAAMGTLTTFAVTNARRADQERANAVASARAEAAAKTDADTQRTRALRQAQAALLAKNQALAATARAQEALRGESIAKAAAQSNALRAESSAATAARENLLAQTQTRIAKRSSEDEARLNYDLAASLAQRAIEKNQFALAASYVTQMTSVLKKENQLKAGFELGYLQQQLHLERLELNGHTGAVESADYSRDGTRILTSSGYDGTARIWNAKTGQMLFTLGGQTSKITAAAFSQDGKRIFTQSANHVSRFWDTETGRLLFQSAPFGNDAYSCTLFPDGKHIAVKDGYAEVGIYDTISGKEVARLKGHTNGISAIAIAQDGTRVATSCTDRTARIWDATTGTQLVSIVMPYFWTTSICFSPDGRRIITGFGQNSDKTARIWDIETGKELSRLRGHTDAVTSVAFSLDGKQIVTGSADSTARVWDASSGAERYQLRGTQSRVNSARFSPDGHSIVTASYDNSARIWDAIGEGDQVRLQNPDASLNPLTDSWVDGVNSAVFSPDSMKVLTAGEYDVARIWDVKTGKQRLATSPPKRKGSVLSFSYESAASFSPDGKKFVMVGWDDPDGHVRDVATGREIATLRGHTGHVLCCAFTPDGQRVLTGSDDKTGRMWDASSGRELFRFRVDTGKVDAVAFSRDGKRFVVADESLMPTVRDSFTGRPLLTFQGPAVWAKSVAFSPDGREVVTGSEQYTAKLWDAMTGRELLTLVGHSNSVTSCAFSADGARVATAGRDDTIRLWDVRNGRELLQIAPAEAALGSSSEADPQIWSIAFSPDGKHLLSGHRDGSARLWQKRTEAQTREAWRQREVAATIAQERSEATAAVAGLQKTPVESLLPAAEHLLRSMPLLKFQIATELNNAAFPLVDPEKPHTDPSRASLARKLAEAAVRLTEERTGDILDTLAAARLADGDRKGAVEAELQALVVSPSSDVYKHNLEVYYLSAGGYSNPDYLDSDEKALTNALQQVPSLQLLRLDRAQIRMLRGNSRGARADFEVLGKAFPFTSEPWAPYWPDLIDDHKARYQKVTREKLAETQKHNPTILNAALLARRAALVPGLVSEYKPFIALGKLAADNAEVRSSKPLADDDLLIYSYGAILLRSGKIAEAITQLEKAHNLNPDRIWQIEFLSLAYAERGEAATARIWYDRAEAWIRTKMNAEFAGPENWSFRLLVLLLRREERHALGLESRP